MTETFPIKRCSYNLSNLSLQEFSACPAFPRSSNTLGIVPPVLKNASLERTGVSQSLLPISTTYFTILSLQVTIMITIPFVHCFTLHFVYKQIFHQHPYFLPSSTTLYLEPKRIDPCHTKNSPISCSNTGAKCSYIDPQDFEIKDSSTNGCRRTLTLPHIQDVWNARANDITTDG